MRENKQTICKPAHFTPCSVASLLLFGLLHLSHPQTRFYFALEYFTHAQDLSLAYCLTPMKARTMILNCYCCFES